MNKRRVFSTLRAVGRILLFVALLIAPSLVRGGYYYRGLYSPPWVSRPDHTTVDVPTVAAVAFADAEAQPGSGRVVFDRAHDNTVEDAELNVLLARLTTRGMEAAWLSADDALPSVLRAAAALVVIAPHKPFSAAEVEAVQRFVEQGGRLLLIGDPGRYSFRTEYDDYVGEYVVPVSDASALNSLASAFGLSFADDYIYNTTENAGNYQYVILRDFVESELTAGLEEVVFYAAHSLAAGDEMLVSANKRTTSSLSEQSGGLATVGLGGAGRVLAVSDLTFMTEPYSAVADNNRLIANIANFVAGAARTFGITEFPHFLGDEVDLISISDAAGNEALSVQFLDEGSALQRTLGSVDKKLYWSTEPSAGHDAFYLGLYKHLWLWPEVGEILAGRGISFTLETAERDRLALTPTPTPRYTSTPTSTSVISPTATPTPKPLRDWIHLAGVGPLEVKETALFYQNEYQGRQVLIVLAYGEEGLEAATSRLISGSFDDCLLDEDRFADPAIVGLALCPTAFEAPEGEATPTPTPTPEEAPETTPTIETLGSVLIVSDDDGEGVYEWWTSAYQFYDIVAGQGYEPRMWSTGLDGEVTLEEMQSHRAVIWCTGDYQQEGGNPSAEELGAIGEYLGSGGRVILVGAFLGDPEERERGLLLDIRVAQADHPVADGFAVDQVIVLERLTAEEDYAPLLLGDVSPGGTVLVRGPDSEFAGEAALFVVEDEVVSSRQVVIGFPIYLLPYDVGNQLGANALRWVAGE